VKWAAMLRGINLGKRQLKSAELKAVVEGMGFTEVKTILASGNVVFEAGDAKPETLERDLHAALEKATGLKSEVFVRNRADLAKSWSRPIPSRTKRRSGPASSSSASTATRQVTRQSTSCWKAMTAPSGWSLSAASYSPIFPMARAARI
jgi:uncharacterized protein (DUF1697 family)